jgi:hypothetical protein
MASRLEILANGYIGRILCERIDFDYKQAFTAFVRSSGDVESLPDRAGPRGRQFVSPTEVSAWWLSEPEALRKWMKARGLPSRDSLKPQRIHRLEGLGSGKDGIGIFEMTIRQNGRPPSAYYPFDPPEGMCGDARRMDRIPVFRLDPPRVPTAAHGFVTVVSGAWARGTMRFLGSVETDFDESRLEIVAVDLTDLGIGEDHFVAGMRYGGQDLSAEVVREESPEPYPVCWYSPTKKTWLGMEEEG